MGFRVVVGVWGLRLGVTVLGSRIYRGAYEVAKVFEVYLWDT